MWFGHVILQIRRSHAGRALASPSRQLLASAHGSLQRPRIGLDVLGDAIERIPGRAPEGLLPVGQRPFADLRATLPGQPEGYLQPRPVAALDAPWRHHPVQRPGAYALRFAAG